MSGIVTLALNPSIDISSDANSVRTAHKVRTSNETYDPGGGGVNVARVIAELGGDVEALYLAGGFTGSLLDDLLERDRVRRRLIRIAGNTRISFTVHERTTGLEYRFVASGPTLQEEELESCLAAIQACQFEYFVASGSLPSGAPPDFYATVAKLVAAKGDPWELYDLTTDRAEQQNLAAKHPDKVKELSDAWDKQTKEFSELAAKTKDLGKGAGKGKKNAE